jgi:opacity protein-like surface antigen
MKAVVVAAAMAAALSFSAAAAVAGVQTTVPSRFVQMEVFLKDNGVIVAYAGGSKSHDNAYPLYGPVPRGDTLTIDIRNAGKKVHVFEFAGRKTKPLKPGGKAHFLFTAVSRGVYNWSSPPEKGKSFHGSTVVA